jgi:hypothetical protein
MRCDASNPRSSTLAVKQIHDATGQSGGASPSGESRAGYRHGVDPTGAERGRTAGSSEKRSRDGEASTTIGWETAQSFQWMVHRAEAWATARASTICCGKRKGVSITRTDPIGFFSIRSDRIRPWKTPRRGNGIARRIVTGANPQRGRSCAPAIPRPGFQKNQSTTGARRVSSESANSGLEIRPPSAVKMSTPKKPEREGDGPVGSLLSLFENHLRRDGMNTKPKPEQPRKTLA